jgi:hypothetical protein
MTTETTYLNESSDGTETFRMGNHDGIPSPVYIPELKGAEGLHAILDHIDALDERNPIMVPAAKWSWLREKNGIRTRTNEQGDYVGEQEIEKLEENHPLVFYDPPELYNYKRTKRLTNYLFRHGAWDKDYFETMLVKGEYSEAFRELPEFISPFLHANINRLLEEVDGAAQVSLSAKSIDTTEEAWTSLEPENFDPYYQVLAAQAQERPSSVLVPPVPQISRDFTDDLIEAWRRSNERMAEAVAGEDCDSYFHLYMDYQSLDPDASDDTASECLRVLDQALEEGDYAGIALTVHQPNNIWQTNRAARMQTFVEDLSDIGSEYELPIICPRSEWFGSFVTDLGVQAFSSLLNGAWQYQRYSSEGGPTGADKYGKTMIPNEARARKLKDENEDDLEEYLEAHGTLPDVDGLPSVPPTYDSSGSSVQEKFGTSPQFRKTFGKPRRLAHVAEAQQFREERASGVENPAREYLRDSENPYVQL